MWSVMLWAQNADMENRWDSTKGERIIEAVAKLRKKREVKLQASINIWRIDTSGPVLAACNPEMDKLKRMDGWDKKR